MSGNSGRASVSVEPADLDDPATTAELARLLAAYHRETARQKGRPVEVLHELPERYRHEIDEPAAAFAGATVLLALDPATPRGVVGCVVLAPVGAGEIGGRNAGGGAHPVVEVKRLWVDAAARGNGTATALLRAAFEHAQVLQPRPAAVRLSVWDWRAGAIALYERLGFVRVTGDRAGESRPGLDCFERSLP